MNAGTAGTEVEDMALNVILIAAAAVLLVLYIARRRARLRQEDERA